MPKPPFINRGKTGSRDAKGRFVKGNPGGPGNPWNQAARNRAKMFAAIKGSDIILAVKTFREIMKNGRDSDKLAAAKLLLDRAVGVAIPLDVVQKIEEMEALVTQLQEQKEESTKWEGYKIDEAQCEPLPQDFLHGSQDSMP